MARPASSRTELGSSVSYEILLTVKLSNLGPLQGANPNIGKVGDLEEVCEHKVEMVVFGKDIALKAVEALKQAHPYEVVAYSVVKAEVW